MENVRRFRFLPSLVRGERLPEEPASGQYKPPDRSNITFSEGRSAFTKEETEHIEPVGHIPAQHGSDAVGQRKRNVSLRSGGVEHGEEGNLLTPCPQTLRHFECDRSAAGQPGQIIWSLRLDAGYQCHIMVGHVFDGPQGIKDTVEALGLKSIDRLSRPQVQRTIPVDKQISAAGVDVKQWRSRTFRLDGNQ